MMNMDDLRELPAENKYIFMGIRAEDTEQNSRIHQAFRTLAKVECKNDYTLTLGKLLEYYEADAKTEMLWAALQNLEQRFAEIENKLREPQKLVHEDDDGAF